MADLTGGEAGRTSLHDFFWPRRIAVIGASNDTARIRGRFIVLLRQHGFDGEIIPVTPSHGEIQGLPAVPRIDAIPGDPVDLALVAVPAPAVVGVLRECAAAGVRGAIELALRHIPEQDASRDLLTEAQHQLARIEGTTAQLLRYARPPALKEVTVDANLLVERAATLVAPQAATARVELQIELCPRPLMVRVDSELLVQVLVNLLLNGIEAMSPGGLLTAWVAAHAPEAWIGVHDTGPGVAPAHGQEIFRPFFSTKHQGTGLGLSISRDIVTRHGGTLRLESDHGKGATFVVALPLAEVD